MADADDRVDLQLKARNSLTLFLFGRWCRGHRHSL